MSDKKDDLVAQLAKLGLRRDEAFLYLELLSGASTHLRLSRNTGIARTRVYRLIDQLEKRGLVQRSADDTGSYLIAASPANLEIEIAQAEGYVRERRDTLSALLPQLDDVLGMAEDGFSIRTYEGARGFRQMCWHELKAKTDVLALGSGTIEELVDNHTWAEKHRALSVEAGYLVRELANIGVDQPTFTSNKIYTEERYSCRGIPKEIILFDNQTVIYNDTVAIYHHRHTKKIGVEIISHSYAMMMRMIFEQYWAQAVSMSIEHNK